MITKNDFNGIGQVANHPDLTKLEIAINEAVTFDLPELFSSFWETIRQIDHELTLQSKNQQLEANNLAKTNENLAKSGKTLSSEYQSNQKQLQELNTEQETLFKKQKNLQIE